MGKQTARLTANSTMKLFVHFDIYLVSFDSEFAYLPVSTQGTVNSHVKMI